MNRAIARGVDFLRRQQRPDGTWHHQEEHRYPFGLTSLCGYTLVKSGIRRSDPVLLKAIEAVRGQEFRMVYSAGCHLLFLEALKEPHHWREEAQRTTDFLLQHQVRGLWAYPDRHIDMSNVQFALLGLRAAYLMDLEIPRDNLADCAKGLWKYQKKDGGFAYTPDQSSTAGMTGATLASLAVLQEIGSQHTMVRGILKKRAKQHQAAVRWLEQNFTAEGNRVGLFAWKPSWHYPNLWAVERFCGLTGRERLGEQDWYRAGAQWLIEQQKASGAWDKGDHRVLEDTCFALLFLRRATITADEELAMLYQKMDQAKFAAERNLKIDPAIPFWTQWWLAGPWDGTEADNLLADPPFQPQACRPKNRRKIARRSWQQVELSDRGWTDLEAHLEIGGDHLLWVLALDFAYRRGTEDPPELDALLWLNLEDGWDLYLDGKRQSFSRRVQAPIIEDVRVPVRLSPGAHRLVVLVEDYGGASAFSCRISDSQGRALGSRVVVYPDGIPNR